MKIILGANAVDRTAHAKRVVRKLRSEDADPRNIRPMGVAYTTAVYPHRCDDCGEQFWSQDQWGAAHIGCRGERRDVGF